VYFDTHCHYDFKQYDQDRDYLLGTALPEFGISSLINAGINIKASRACIDLAKKYNYIYAAVGFHPHNAHEMKDGDAAILEELAKEPKVVAIGEIGLDYHYDYAPKDVQRKRFVEQLKVAESAGLPVLVHCREADDDVYEILCQGRIGEKVGGVLHCFSGTADMAKKYVDMGFYIGIGGVVTYKNAGKLREVVENTPLEHLVLETDCPYLAPEPNRGHRNNSQNLSHIAEKIGEIVGTSGRDVAHTTKSNAKKLFGIL